jgi:hypothetical protein
MRRTVGILFMEKQTDLLLRIAHPGEFIPSHSPPLQVVSMAWLQE